MPAPGRRAAAADRRIHGRLHPLGTGQGLGHRPLGADGGRGRTGPLPTYPGGFPARADRRAAGRRSGHELICNRPDNGIAAIEDFGAEHLRTGALILYTSQDSVLQLAAHVERLAPAELYRACEAAARGDERRATPSGG